MILIQATIKYKGYDPRDLKPKSNKHVCCSCDQCGKIRYIPYQDYRDLCRSCCQKGNKNSMYGIYRYGKDSPHWKGGLIKLICIQCNKEYKKNLAKKDTSKFCSLKCKGEWKSINNKGKNNPNYGIRKYGLDNPNYKGGIDRKRSYVLPEVQCRKMNNRFKGSEFHHLSKSYGVYIPKILHRHIWHSLKSGQGMDEMSILAFQFIRGELNYD